MKFDALVERIRDQMNAQGANSIYNMDRAMVTKGEAPHRRIDQVEFHCTLTRFGVAGSVEDGQVLIENLTFETDGLIDYDKFWTELSGEGKVPSDHRKLTPEIINEWQGYARQYPRFWSDRSKTKNEIMDIEMKMQQDKKKKMATP